MKEEQIQAIRRMPSLPGVYIFKNHEGKTIYVGKAKSLRHRVRSYFQRSAHHTPKTRRMISEIEAIDSIVTKSEVEAIILEANLIKKEKPKYNIVLRDDKNFPYLKLTIQEEFPRVVLVRKAQKDGNLYFGPFLPARTARWTLKLIPRFFKIPIGNHRVDKKRRRACLYYQLDQCLACDENVDRETYRKAVGAVKLFLEGRNRELIADLTEKMKAASAEEKYEEAASCRDTIATIERLSARQNIISVGLEDQDYFAHYRENERVALQLFNMRNGHVQSRCQFTFEGIDLEKESFYQMVLLQYYSGSNDIPDSIYIPEAIKEIRLVEKTISALKGKRVKICIPSRGPKKSFLHTVGRNAMLLFESRFRKEMSPEEIGLTELSRSLGMPFPIETIECFDISNISGKENVGSMVVFEKGKPLKQKYRKFRIKTVSAPDDFASIEEVVSRRYARLLKENGRLPDLIIVDGGKGQLSSAVSALKSIGLDSLPVAAFEKKDEKLFLSQKKKALRLESNSRALHLVRRIRDEAHRYAVSYHRIVRGKTMRKTELTSIRGIGEKRAQRLLREFGSVSGVKNASTDAIERIVGKNAAARLKERFSGQLT